MEKKQAPLSESFSLVNQGNEEANAAKNENIFKLNDKINAIFCFDKSKDKPIVCDKCSEIISENIKIVSVIKESQSILCIKCFFKVYLENKDTKPAAYAIIDKEFHFFNKYWSFAEEMKLIQGIQEHGLDNWETIADSIEGKSAEECEAQYYSFLCKNEAKNMKFDEALIENEQQLAKNASIYENALTLINNTRRYTPSEIPARDTSKMPPQSDKYYFHGYNIRRKELDSYNYEIESELAELKIDGKYQSKVKDLIFKRLDLYNKEIRAYEEKLEFIKSRYRLNLEYQQKFEGNLSENELNLVNCLMPFEKYLSLKQSKELIEDLFLSRKLYLYIEELNACIQKNIKTFEEKEQHFSSAKYTRKQGISNPNEVIYNHCGLPNKKKSLFQSTFNGIESDTGIFKEFSKFVHKNPNWMNNTSEQVIMRILKSLFEPSNQRKKNNNQKNVINYCLKALPNGRLKNKHD